MFFMLLNLLGTMNHDFYVSILIEGNNGIACDDHQDWPLDGEQEEPTEIPSSSLRPNNKRSRNFMPHLSEMHRKSPALLHPSVSRMLYIPTLQKN